MAPSAAESEVGPEASAEQLWDRRHAARWVEAEAKKQARQAKHDHEKFQKACAAFWAERKAHRDAEIRELWQERAAEIVVEALGLRDPRPAAVTQGRRSSEDTLPAPPPAGSASKRGTEASAGDDEHDPDEHDAAKSYTEFAWGGDGTDIHIRQSSRIDKRFARTPGA